jgi:integrase
MKGHVRERSPGHWAIILDQRDPATGKHKRKWHSFKGTKREAQTECSRLITGISDGSHVEPSKLAVGEWITQWLEAGAPGRRRKKVSQRTVERYGQLLRTHVTPVLGGRPLQKLQATEIDKLYLGLERKIAPRTAHHVHTVLGACLATAHRKGLITANPMIRVEQVPNPEAHTDEPDDIGEGLTEGELKTLIADFEASPLYPVVALAAASGARRNELLALRWTDLDTDKKTLKIERAWEQTKKYGLRLKPPKTKRGLRTIDLDDATVGILLKHREGHLRLVAGIPDSVGTVDLALVRLPAAALMFPALFGPGRELSFSAPKNPRNFKREFSQRAEALGFGNTRFHDLRGIHSTALLDAGIPVHTVAQRIGDDPATLLPSYTKRKRSKQADENLSKAIAALTASFLSKG